MIALENDHGYPVGHCSECRFIQTKLYFIIAGDKEGYCLTCFPKIVELKDEGSPGIIKPLSSIEPSNQFHIIMPMRI